ncbi:hypothetical protein CC78DRAFT_585900 [Lojkania enalia]|uniref:Uncharacterized protein n=1 Tax=Lojkania enalia TaxID=147567 RepID=A0A9P4K4V7_9PLEO|nr:hypothetical protein CC78DRAFT_585900 [Didymosphaeria enalia]
MENRFQTLKGGSFHTTLLTPPTSPCPPATTPTPPASPSGASSLSLSSPTQDYPLRCQECSSITDPTHSPCSSHSSLSFGRACTSSQSPVSGRTSSLSSVSSVSSSSDDATTLPLALLPIIHLYASGQIYGKYDLGRGRRGAISGPSSGYCNGQYDGRGRHGRGDGIA